MIKTNEFSKALTEIDYILKCTDEKLVKNIPGSFWDFINENKDKEYKVTINMNIPLENQNIKEDTKNLMAIIYRNYFCTLNEKIEYDEILGQNQNKYDEELKQKYSYENLFKNNKLQKDEEVKKEEKFNMQIIEYKNVNIFQKIFQKIFNKIKNFFYKLKK